MCLRRCIHMYMMIFKWHGWMNTMIMIYSNITILHKLWTDTNKTKKILNRIVQGISLCRSFSYDEISLLGAKQTCSKHIWSAWGHFPFLPKSSAIDEGTPLRDSGHQNYLGTPKFCPLRHAIKCGLTDTASGNQEDGTLEKGRQADRC